MTRPCPTCRYRGRDGTGCVLIEGHDFKSLIRSGQCLIIRWVGDEAMGWLRRHGMEQAGLVEAIRREVADRLLNESGSVPSDLDSRLESFKRWLRPLVATASLDLLQSQDLLPRVSCGLCVHLRRKGGNLCGLSMIPDGDLTGRPNPWFGACQDPHQDPRELSPACREFTWDRRWRLSANRTTPSALPTDEDATEVLGQVDTTGRSRRRLAHAIDFLRTLFQR